MTDRRGGWLAALLGALAAAAVTLPGLGGGTLWDNSETVYGEVAREILLLHDAVVMHLNGAPWFVQPPLYFWVAAAFAKLLGATPLALRLPSALATIAMGAVTAWFARREAGMRAAAFAAVVLATSLMQAIVGRLAIMDALLDLAVCLATLSAFVALRSGSRGAWYGAWVAVALGVLAKGPVALAVPVMVVACWAVWERRSGGAVRVPSPLAWFGAAVLFAGIVVPWFVLSAHAAGAVALRELVGHYTVGRYLGTIENQSGPVWYYVPVVILGFFPWIAFLAPAAELAVRRARGAEDGAAVRLALAWAVVPFVFFSFAQTKLPNYVALELPALALLVALWFDAVVDEEKRRVPLIWAALVPLALGGLAFAIFAFSRTNRLGADLHELFGDLAWLGGMMALGSVLCFVLLAIRRAAPLAPFALGAASACAMIFIACVAESHAERFKPMPGLGAIVNRERLPGDVVGSLGVAGSYGLMFATRPPVLEFPPPETARLLRDAICGSSRLFLVTSHAPPVPIVAYGRRMRVLATQGKDVLYLFDGSPCSISR